MTRENLLDDRVVVGARRELTQNAFKRPALSLRRLRLVLHFRRGTRQLEIAKNSVNVDDGTDDHHNGTVSDE